MIARSTIVWFVLLLGFTAAIWFGWYRANKPCIDWKKANPHYTPNPPIKASDGTYTMSFTPCDMLLEPRDWQRYCSLGWFVVIIAFPICLIRDLYRWFKKRHQRVGEAT